jgi:hypothetical protein
VAATALKMRAARIRLRGLRRSPWLVLAICLFSQWSSALFWHLSVVVGAVMVAPAV